MDIKARLSKLESVKPGRECKTWVILQGEAEPEGIEPDDRLIICPDEQTKELTLRLIAGEGP
jgi:hypothetical protein